MTYPTVSATTERLYRRLPGHYRDEDYKRADGPNGYPLLRFISLVVDQLGVLESLTDRIDYVPPHEGGAPGDTSDLVDPATADDAWLRWLAQLVGLQLPVDLVAGVAARDAIAGAASGWRAGSKAALRAAARSELTGTRHVEVYDHRTAAGAGGQWDVLIVTRASETPGGADILKAVNSKRAKGAGIKLYWRAFEASWAAITTAYPTWSAIHTAGSWAVLQETGL